MTQTTRFKLWLVGFMAATAIGFYPTGAHASDYTGPPPTVTQAPIQAPAVHVLAKTGVDYAAFLAAALVAILAGIIALLSAVYVARQSRSRL